MIAPPLVPVVVVIRRQGGWVGDHGTRVVLVVVRESHHGDRWSMAAAFLVRSPVVIAAVCGRARRPPARVVAMHNHRRMRRIRPCR